jgi:hypothetical protein
MIRKINQTNVKDEVSIGEALSIPVFGLKCGHAWKHSKGKPRYRIRCPVCHSTRNELNRYTFGRWRNYDN